jgi:hypothetical protein
VSHDDNPYRPPAARLEPAASPDAKLELYACPRCRQSTSSLKRHDFPQVIFALLFRQTESKTITACPRCLRRYLLGWGALSLVTANLVWPIAIAPLLICRFIASFRRGHYLGEASAWKSVLGAIAVVGLVICCVTAGLTGAILVLALVLATPESMYPVLMIFGSCVTAMIVFGILGAIADV